jgi:hypothetical protein
LDGANEQRYFLSSPASVFSLFFFDGVCMLHDVMPWLLMRDDN